MAAGNQQTKLNLTDAQRLDWLRLFRSDNVGPRGIMAQAVEAIRPHRSHFTP
jgi:hypothetical protein